MTKRILLMAGIGLLLAGTYLGFRNHQEARRQADQIVARDNQGQDVASQVIAIKSFVSTHTAASVTFTLEAAYQRAQEQAKQQAEAAASSSQLYSAAQQACAGRTDSITQSRCVQDYVSRRLTAAPAPTPVSAPKAADFTYSLGSPLWTSDGAGALLLGGMAALALAVIMGLRRKRRDW